MRGGIKKKLDESKDYIIYLYKTGYTQKEIASIFDVSQGTIGRRLNKWGIITAVPIDNAVLKNMYINDCLTCREIAAFFNVSTSCINYKLHTLGIYSKSTWRPFVKTLLRKDISKGIIYNLYYNKKLSMSEIANGYGCSRSSIGRRFMEYGLKPRDRVEAHLKGKKHPNYGKPMSIAAKIKQLNTIKGKTIVIKSYGKGNGAYYDTPHQGRMWMRSGWELKVADYLTSQSKDWYYEYKWLDIGDTHYLPDFYLPVENKYIEVKGWKTDKTMKKYNIAKEIYEIELWDKTKLESMGISIR